MTTEQPRSHFPPGEENPTFSKKINPKTRACFTCHQRKVRCDILTKGSPCTNCLAQDKPDCHIYEKKKLHAAQARYARRPRRIIAIQPRNHQTQQPIQAASASQDDTDRPEWTAVTPLDRVSEDISSPLIAQELPREQRQDARQDDRGSAVQSASSDDRDQLNEQTTRNLADFLDNSVEKADEIDANHRMHFIGNEFSNLNYLVRRRASHLNHNQLHFGSQRSLPRISSAPAEALKLPEKSLTDELVQAYFSRINPGWPIVDEEDFMERYRCADPRKPVPLLLLHSILLVGAHVSASRHKDYKSLKACFFRRAKMLIDARYEEDRKVYIQAALLMTWNCDHLEDIVSNSWYWVGFAARTALGLGMHRDTSQSRMSAVTKREWIRLWWVLFQFDVLVSVAHGRPQAIRLDESDTPPLQRSHFEGIPNAKVAFVTAHTHLCVMMSRSMRQILQLNSSPADRTDAIMQAGESLGQFVTQLPDCLRLPQLQADTWQSFLQLTYNNFLILLHRPPAQAGPSSCLADASGHSSICADAIVVITSTFEFIGATRSFGELALPSVYTLFTSLVHVSGEIASPNPLVAAKSKRMLDSLLNSLRELAHYYIYPRSILRVFEGQAERERQRRDQCDGPDQAFAADPEQDHIDISAHGDSLDLFLTRCLLEISPSGDFWPTNGHNNMFLTPSSNISSQTSLFTTATNPGADRNLSTEARDKGISQDGKGREGSIECDLMADDPDTIPCPWALDLLSDCTSGVQNLS